MRRCQKDTAVLTEEYMEASGMKDVEDTALVQPAQEAVVSSSDVKCTST